MKAILMSIKPKWCEKIFNGEKTVEVRKTAPKLELPFKVYVYESLGKKFSCSRCEGCPIRFPLGCNEGAGAVVGEFVCDWVIEYSYQVISCAKFEVNGAYVKEENRYNAGACLSEEEMYEYSNGKPLYGLHIAAPKRYDMPKELHEFRAVCKKGKTKPNKDCKGCTYAFKGVANKEIICDRAIVHAPHTWVYVEEIEE